VHMFGNRSPWSQLGLTLFPSRIERSGPHKSRRSRNRDAGSIERRAIDSNRAGDLTTKRH
jgi:hypothetical protein